MSRVILLRALHHSLMEESCDADTRRPDSLNPSADTLLSCFVFITETQVWLSKSQTLCAHTHHTRTHKLSKLLKDACGLRMLLRWNAAGGEASKIAVEVLKRKRGQEHRTVSSSEPE